VQFDVNYFGPLWTSRAVLPGMRSRGGGRIIQISSFGGLVSFPTMGLYHSSKWALEAVSEALAAEVAPFGIHVTIVEPLTFPTDLGVTAPVVPEDPAYDGVRAALVARMRDSPFTPGDPASTSAALLAIADAPEPPLRVLFGSPGFEVLQETYAQRLAGLERWLDIAQLAQGSATPSRAT
jgi:NAD(P)-dependent dehydrogenase (short-subunit alcohol dehydrogenase family)